ncbi:MAG: diphthine--ammonia ligase [Sulfolobales archaeon]
MDRFLALYTGGKDSHYALYIALKLLKLGKPYILNITSSREDLYYLHTINSRWAKIHAEIMGIEFISKEIRGDREFDEIKEVISRTVLEINAKYIVSGVVSSNFQKRALDSIASELGIKHIAPLWGRDHRDLLIEEVIERGIGFVIVAVQAMGLDERWIGREIITREDVEELLRLSSRYSFSPIGEGGEYESFVVRSPLFKGRRIITSGEKKWFLSGWGYMRITNVEIV